MEKPIDLYLISGFLGAGKTTLLRRMLAAAEEDARIGVIVNELGSIGIDGKLIKRRGIELVEINNGSIFCACLKDGFSRTLHAFARQPIDTLVIENSGAGDPSAMPKLLAGLAPYLERPYAYRGSVCMVDCTSFLDLYDVLLPVQNQAATADVLILNKVDLAEPSELLEIRALLQTINGEALVLEAEYADVPLEVLRSLIRRNTRELPGTNTPQSRPFVCTVQISAAQSAGDLLQFLQLLSPHTARIKGFVRENDGGWLHVEAACKHWTVEPAQEVPFEQGQLVIIGSGPSDLSGSIVRAWQTSCRGSLHISGD